MKLNKKDQDYLELKQAVIGLLNEITIEELLLHKQALAKDLSIKDHHKRFRWNLLYAINRDIRTPIIDRIYSYANDDHIDTALKHIVGALSL